MKSNICLLFLKNYEFFVLLIFLFICLFLLIFFVFYLFLGSLITKSWRSYMDELDQQAKQFKSNAEQIEVVCEKLAHLSQDKRKARKTYQEEHTKIAARLNHVSLIIYLFILYIFKF